MAIQGTISQWHGNRGYGYIMVDDQNTQIKFHLYDLDAFGQTPRISERVRFKLSKDQNGELRAVKVERTLILNFSFAVTIWFLTVLVASIILLDYPLLMGMLYVAMSALSYAVYAFDKHAMHENRWRVPTATYHLLSLLGGWPGAMLAQSILHHKYNDFGFKGLFWLTVLVNFALFCFSLTERGALILLDLTQRILVAV